MQKEVFLERFIIFIKDSDKACIKDFFDKMMDEFEEDELDFIKWFRQLYTKGMNRRVNIDIMLLLLENNFDLWFDSLRFREISEENP
jgi:hypothetical protein